jgi:biotin synthase-related radical SAM superfamily protein
MLEVYSAIASQLRQSDIRSQDMAAGCAKCGACSALALFENEA